MEAEAINTPEKRNRYPALLWLSRLWNKIINTGLNDSASLFDHKRVRLLNGICFVGCSIYVFYVLDYLETMIEDPANTRSLLFEFSVSLVGATFAFIPFVINSRGKYALACHVFNISNILLYFYSGVVAGGHDATQNYFIASSLAPLMFFKEMRTVSIYFIINLTFFGLTEYLITKIPPLVTWDGQQSEVIANYITLFCLLFFMVNYFKSENKRQENLLEYRNVKLNDEKKRSDDLLLNILPAETADELKEKGSTQARDYEMVTVLFTDFKEFTKVSESMSAQELVNEINYCYSEFDRIVSSYGIEKIKTIGDGYMAAGGLPVKNTTNPVDAVNAAFGIRDFMHEEKARRSVEGKPFFEIRIGLHTGPVVAGVVGIKKFAYDIWGDTVNTASRMETSGEAGKINISGSTYELIKDHFHCSYRGKVEAKNKGLIDMYFVEQKQEA